MGPGNQQRREPDVIIPEIGAAKYWYVDPSAQGVPSPSSNLNQSFDPRPVFSGERSGNEISNVGEALSRLMGNPKYQAFQAPPQERSDIYDRMRHKGMLEPPSVDHEVAEGTGTFKIDDQTYILPTQVEGTRLSKEEAVKRFKETGEHLGIFETEKDARFYEDNYLTPQATKFSF